MSFADLSERFDDGLHLPIDGVVYDIPSPDHDLGLYVTALMTASWEAQQGITRDSKRRVPQLHFSGEEGDEESEEAQLYQRLLGPAYDLMKADGVTWAKIKFVSETVMIWIAVGLDTAEKHWNRGGQPDPKAPELTTVPNRAERRRATVSTPTGTANTTGTRGSTRATTSRSAKKSAPTESR